MNRLVGEIDAEVQEKSLLKHTFYKMWSEGKLTREHLAGYAKEYYQLVKAVPDLVGEIGEFVDEPRASSVISGIRREETEHIELWAKFAEEFGVSRADLDAYRGTEKTRRAISRLRRTTKSSFCEGAAAMYAIESEQPKISRTKLDGLKSFYGMKGTEEGTEYFREHEVADIRHAGVWRGMIQRRAKGGEEASTLSASQVSLDVQNAILDSVMETYVDV